MNQYKYFLNRIITKYVLLIKEFFDLVNQSDTIKNLHQPSITIDIGINIMNRVFEYVLMKQGSINIAYYYSQKSYYYYLEYMEQINNTEILNNLNHIDAVLFIYKKTIFDINNGNNENTETVSSLQNIISLNDELVNEFSNALIVEFRKISTFTKILFHFDNTTITFEQQYQICNFLNRYLQKLEIIESLIFIFETLQTKVTIPQEKYMEFVKELLIKIELTKKPFTFKTKEERSEAILKKFYMGENNIIQKFHDLSAKEIVTLMLPSFGG